MTNKPLLVAVALLLTFHSYSQDETIKNLRKEAEKNIKKDADTTKRIWRKGGLYNLNIAQGALNNWAAGGDEFSLSLNSVLNVFAFYKKNKTSWDNIVDFNLGYVKTSSLGSRKNDDRIDILSKYGYALNPKLNAAGLFNFRSQFFKGYTYTDDVKTLASNFLSPAYILLSAGLDYKPTANLSIFVSPLTSRWIIVNDDTLSARGQYGVDPGKHSKNEIGAFASINYIKVINKNVGYKGRLDLFSNYKRDPGNVDLFMSNMLNVTLSKVLAVTWSVDLIYDDNVKLFGKNKTSPALQLKSLVGIGFLVKF